MKLRHLSLRNITDYAHAQTVQDKLVRSFLSAKASSSPSTAPPPTIITHTPYPTYTCGRREISRLTPSQKQHLQIPYSIPRSTSESSSDDPETQEQITGTSAFYETLRGGQTTYHGPGQLVAYSILDLRAHNLGARDYVCLLESAIIDTVAQYGIKGTRTANPGVWVRRSTDELEKLQLRSDNSTTIGREGGNTTLNDDTLETNRDNGTSDNFIHTEEKICALGVHLRRNVSSHGIALNVTSDPLWWLQRIVACGLEGVGATSIQRESYIRRLIGDAKDESAVHTESITVDQVARVFVSNMATRLSGVQGVEEISETDVLD